MIKKSNKAEANIPCGSHSRLACSLTSALQMTTDVFHFTNVFNSFISTNELFMLV